MELNDITAAIVEAAYQIHQEVGPGLFESVYELVLADALMEKDFLSRGKPSFRSGWGRKFTTRVSERTLWSKVALWWKSNRSSNSPASTEKQLLTYLKLSGIPVGLLINFVGDLLKGNIERLVAGNAPNLKT